MLMRAVVAEDHPQLLAQWQQAPEICVREDDAFAPFCRYLSRNPELSVLLEMDGQIVASVLAGHDGRRGYLQHLLVQAQWRGRGLAKRLLNEVLTRLAAQGISKTHVLVLRDADAAMAFWQAQPDWQLREDVQLCSCVALPNGAVLNP